MCEAYLRMSRAAATPWGGMYARLARQTPGHHWDLLGFAAFYRASRAI